MDNTYPMTPLMTRCRYVSQHHRFPENPARRLGWGGSSWFWPRPFEALFAATKNVFHNLLIQLTYEELQPSNNFSYMGDYVDIFLLFDHFIRHSLSKKQVDINS